MGPFCSPLAVEPDCRGQMRKEGIHLRAAIRTTLIACTIFVGVSACSLRPQGLDTVFLGYAQYIRNVAVSPDGSKLAFLYSGNVNSPKIYDIYVCNRDGTGLARIASLPSHSASGADPYVGLPKATLKNTSAPCDFTDFSRNSTGTAEPFVPSSLSWDQASFLTWAANGNLYCVDADGNLVCLQQDGTKKWLVQAPTNFASVCPNYPEGPSFGSDYGFRSGGLDVSKDGTLFVSTQGVVFDSAGEVKSVLLRDVYPKGLVCPRFSPDRQSVAALEVNSGLGVFELDASPTVVVMSLSSSRKTECVLPDRWQPQDLHWLQTNRLMSEVIRRTTDFSDSDIALATYKPDGTDFQLSHQVNGIGQCAISPDGEDFYEVVASDDGISSSLYSINLVSGTRQLLIDAKKLPQGDPMYAQ